ncbi:NAD(P)-dependent oxidoreductase [Clostridium tyrobutyricum]|uniref:NAD(P)-dependent oxidoreductase n=1 Tax=Clostridium tyrobutyricum TaxID=1519 RepID=UPI0009B91DFA|nr:NAD(P)-dependent oxidoreductase [Clostridium tyrobutyricum]MBR9648822.1 NAD(P)-dependent oxidoreductase [Clostridium tyrobutyricum]MBV4448828.1 NAD(P)-dependent oxidoreductase [Clostridium tyrobutyricum]
MHREFKRQVIELDEKLLITLLSNKVNVLIIGGGRAAYIKSKTFSDKNCNVQIVSKKFLKEFDGFKYRQNVNMISDEYNQSYICDKHIIVIASDDSDVNAAIRRDCGRLYKIYIDCTKPGMGNSILPCQRSTNSLYFGVNTYDSSPRTAVFISDIIKNNIEKYDDFISFTCNIRNSLPKGKRRSEIMRFICCKDFYFFYKKKKSKIIIDMFYNNEV